MPRFAKILIGIALVPVVLVLLIGLYLAIHSDDVLKSVFRNTANIVFLGIPLLFHKTLEVDGSAVCKDAMDNNIDLTVNRPPPKPEKGSKGSKGVGDK